MKKLILLISSLLWGMGVFAQSPQTDAFMTGKANQIISAGPGENTALRIGTNFQYEIDSKVNVSNYAFQSTTGTDTYTVTVSPVPPTFTNFRIWVRFINANTGAVTLTVTTLGTKAVVNEDGSALSSGSIPAGAIKQLAYNGTSLQIVGGGGSGGGATSWAALTGKPADLTTIAGLTPSNDDFLQRKSGAWANRTIAQVKTDLGIPGSFAVTTSPLSQFAATTSAQLISTISDETGTGALVFGTSPSFTTPNIGSATGSISGNAGTATILATGRTFGFLGDATGTSGSFDGSGNASTTLSVVKILGNTIPANASGVLTNNGSGTLTWAAAGGTGTVTSVGSFSPLFTTSSATTTPTFTAVNQNANLIYSGPGSGGAAAPTFRSLVTADIPTLNQNTSGTAANLSGTPALPNGTTATTQSAGDASGKLATTLFTTTAINNAIAGVNPAVAVQAASAAVLPNTPTYSNGVIGIGATLTSSTNSVFVVDGYTPALNERILVKNQASSFQNGVYYISQLGVGSVTPWILTRALDYDQPSDMNNTGAIPVINGTTNAVTSWVQSSQVTTVGTDAVTFIQFTFQKVAGLSVIGNSTNATASAGALTSTAPNQIMYSASDGLTVGWHDRADAFVGSINTITSADYSVQATDRWNTVQMTSSSAQTVTFTTSSGVAVGDKVLLIRSGSAAYSYVAGPGVTFTPAGGTLGNGLDAGLGVYHVATYMGSNVWNINNGQAVSISSGDVTGALGFTPGRPADFIIQSSSNTLASSTSAQAIFNVSGATNGAFTAVASTTYRFRCVLNITNLSSSSATVSFGFGGTATFTSIGWGGITQRQTTLSTGAAPNYMVYSTSASASAITSATTTTSIYTTLEGTIRVNGAGTIIPQLTMGSASASVVQPNSGFWIQNVGTDTVVKQGNWN